MILECYCCLAPTETRHRSGAPICGWCEARFRLNPYPPAVPELPPEPETDPGLTRWNAETESWISL